MKIFFYKSILIFFLFIVAFHFTFGIASKNIKSEQDKYDLAASFQNTIEEILYEKTKIAFKEFSKDSNKNQNVFVIAGGVASNKGIRKKLIQLGLERSKIFNWNISSNQLLKILKN